MLLHSSQLLYVNILLLVVIHFPGQAFCQVLDSQKLDILIVTGGHDFDTVQFFQMFDSFENVEYTHVIQPLGNQAFVSRGVSKYHAVVFYDMIQEITEEQKLSYLQVLEEGKGLVFLHHALVSYQAWKEFRQIIGGKYYLEQNNAHEASTYKHNQDINVEVLERSHPITDQLSNFQIRDETYGNFEVLDDVTPLLYTEHPNSTKTIAWAHKYLNSKVVYIQLGHGPEAFLHPSYRQLVNSSIRWVAD